MYNDDKSNFVDLYMHQLHLGDLGRTGLESSLSDAANLDEASADIRTPYCAHVIKKHTYPDLCTGSKLGKA